VIEILFPPFGIVAECSMIQEKCRPDVSRRIYLLKDIEDV
jgi:hypothetical protein